MRSAHRLGMALCILCAAVSACGKQDARARAANPDTPAVVKVAPPILPGDTAKRRDTTVVSVETAKATMSRNYAVLGAAISFGDQKMVAAQYAPTASLSTPDGTFNGKAAIVHELARLRGLKDFTRMSFVTSIVDSTVSDSGKYVMVVKRAGADSSVERGAYAAIWRIHPEPLEWVMTQDHLYPMGKKNPK